MELSHRVVIVFNPSAATNQQNSVRDVFQLSQNQTFAIFEANQQAHHNN